MAIQGVDTKCYILALFVRDDGERFLLGSGHYEFKDTQMHFAANAIQNDIVEVQGNDGFLLAGQVRRPGTQSFDGYVGDGTMSKEETESYRRQFFSFFRKNFFYKVIYVFSDGTAIQRKSGFLVDDPTVEELYQMYPEYHVALNFEDVNYYSYSEDEEGQEQYAKEATIDTSSMRATGGLVWDNVGVVWEATQWGGEQTASGTEMTIQNDMNVPSRVDDIRLDGDTEQQTYSGKNVFNENDLTYDRANVSANQIQLSALDTGIRFDTTYISTTGSPSITFNTGIDLTPLAGKTIRLKANFGEKGEARIMRLNDDSLSAENKSLTVSGDTISWVVPNDLGSSKWLGYGFRIVYPSNEIHTVDFTNVCITIDNADMNYEPYTGGYNVPSPNPDYPQPIQVVTGEQTVTATGKNLFSSAMEFGSLNSQGGIPGSTTTDVIRTVDYIAVMPNTTYTVSNNNNYYNYIYQYDGNKNFIYFGTERPSYTFTTYSNTRFIKLRTNAGTVENDLSTKFQLELGSTPSTYVPYVAPQSYTVDLGATELCKIGDYQDYIYESGDDWYMHKETARVDVSSLSGWFASGSYAYKTRNGMSDILPASSDSATAVGLCNAFSASTTNLVYAGSVDYGFALPGAGGTGVLIRNKNVASLADFTTYLSNNPVYGYFALATPTDTKITDNTLVGQLNALGAMRLFVGENNLAIQATGTNLPAPLSFKYYTTVAMTGAVWEEGGSGGATVVEVDSITNTYPIWRVKGPAVNPQLSVVNTNTTIRYTGTVTSTQTLEIDMFNKTAKLNGVSVIGNVSGDWVSLAPGTNRVIYTAENADAQPSTIEWQEVVG